MNAETIAKALGNYSRQGNRFMVQCPAHDDKNPSLSITDDNGKVLVHCKAGCTQDAVITALKDRQLWPEQQKRDEQIKQSITGRYVYRDAAGNPFHTKERLEPAKNGRKKEFRFFHEDTSGKKIYKRRGGEKILYHLPDVLKSKSIIITEGEKHADLVKGWGLTGTSLDSGADSKLTEEQITQLTGKRIAILRDNDPPGLVYSLNIAKPLQGKCESLKIVLLPDLPEKGDVIDWAKEPGNDKARLLEIIKATPGWEPSENYTEEAIGTPCQESEQPSFDLSRLTLGADIAAGDYTVTFVVDKLIPENSVILFYAKGGSGKSTLATQIGGAVDAGLQFMGLSTNKRPVVIVDYENPLAVLSKRIKAVEGAENIHFWTGSNTPPQLDKSSWSELKDLTATLKNPLIIIDTLSSSCSNRDILSNGDFSPVMQKIIELRNLGATIVLLHHTPKQDETKYIGASCIYNQCDHILAMYPVKDAGAEKEAIDEDDAKVYRLGTKDKTRFEHFTMYVEFDEDKGTFVTAADPDREILTRVHEIITAHAPINQSTVMKYAKGIVQEKKLKRLLKNNEGRLWHVEKGERNANIYRPIQLGSFADLYGRKTAELEHTDDASITKLGEQYPSQYLDSHELGSYAGGTARLENVPVFNESDFLELGAV